MPLSSIALQLRLTVGLATESLGGTALESAVRTRMRSLGMRGVDEYADRVGSDSSELHQLVEELIVPETWFFRESGAYRELAARALAAQTTRPGRIFRVLSAPCSTGEEPYSMAITLLDVGLSPSSFKIDAVDISKVALAAAARGLYRPHSFRGVEEDFRTRYFDARDGEFQIAAEVRECVHFFPANLADPNFLANEIPYQVIFCRNVLIYMHDEARAKALAALSRLLDRGGVLFAGHAEALESMSRHFKRAGPSFAFSHRDAVPRAERSSARPATSTPAPPPRRELATSIAAMARAPAPPSRPSVRPIDLLAQAAELADRGELDRAAALCERHLVEHGPSREAHSQLLDLALLAERRGDAATAGDLRRRAERAKR